MRTQALSLFVVLALSVPAAAQAVLLERLGGDAYYDTVLDITWLADTNLAATNAFGVAGINGDGSLNWDTANDWIDAMNSAMHLGIDGWRLPDAFNQDGSGPCFGYGCDDSEMGYMFYQNLGVAARSSVTSGDPLLNPFQNLQTDRYWNSTTSQFVHMGPSFVSTFSFNDGIQSDLSPANFLFAWAVRDGDVADAVPAPGTMALLVGSLAGFAAVRRRWRRRARR